jgi:hypothetical protein
VDTTGNPPLYVSGATAKFLLDTPTIEAYGGVEAAPLILNLDTLWRLVLRYTCRPLYTSGKEFLYPLIQRLGGLQRQSGLFEEDSIRDSNCVDKPHAN